MAPPSPRTVLDARALGRTLRRMADEIVELNNGTDGLVLVGIQRRGVQLAARLVALIAEREKVTVAQGALDITLYRDDLQTVGPRPVVGPTMIPVDIEGKHIVIVDDVTPGLPPASNKAASAASAAFTGSPAWSVPVFPPATRSRSVAQIHRRECIGKTCLPPAAAQS